LHVIDALLVTLLVTQMAFVRRVLRVFLKRLRVALAVAQCIAGLLQSTFRNTRLTREFWSVSEVLIKRFIPAEQENIHGVPVEDGSSEAANDRVSQPGTTASVEGEMEIQTKSDDLVDDTIITCDYEKDLMLVQQDSTDLGECFSACTISGTAMDVEEVFDDHLPRSKIKVCETVLQH